MKRSFAVLAVGATLAVGCGNTPVTLGGRTLSPLSADMMQVLGFPYVIVSDVQDYCGKLKAAYPGGGSCNSPAPATGSNPYAAVQGSFLIIAAYGASDGAKLPVLTSDGGYSNPYAVPAGSTVQFVTWGNLATSFQATAVAGSVNIEAFRSAQSISGNYDVTFDDGEKKAGHFAALYCDAYEKIFASLATTRNCYDSSGTNSCARSCTCNSKSVSASCSLMSGSTTTWQCSCTSATGGSSTCTMNSSSNCASDTGTCCPLTF